MYKHILMLFTMVFLITTAAFAQPGSRGMPGQRGGSISGKVFDLWSNEPIEYANIVLFSQQDSTQIIGTITDREGKFKLMPVRRGPHYLTVSFIGYEEISISDIKISQSDPHFVEFKIDKKIVNVSQMHTAATGNAVDVLENVPSVTVDIEGNVSLRGSSNFTVLIDGAPTVLDANDALQQIPSSSINSIEIITNPSVKYDPDGTSGIINILMKKGKNSGTNGVVNVNGGVRGTYGGDALINIRNEKIGGFFGLDYNKRAHPGDRRGESQTWVENDTSYVVSDGEMDRNMTSWGLRGGLNVRLTEQDQVNMGLRYGSRSFAMEADMDYDVWSSLDNVHSEYRTASEVGRSHDFYSGTVDYKRSFRKKGHELSSQVYYSHRDGDESSHNERFDMTGNLISSQESTEEGPSDQFRWKLDYTLPLRENEKFEAGYQLRSSASEDNTKFLEYNPDTGEYEEMTQFSNSSDYTHNIQSLYSIYSGESDKLGYMVGFRTEYTDRVVTVEKSGDEFTIDRWDYFPSAHVSWHFSDEQQIMASYTRRIERPRGWYLEPFETWIDAYNVRKGNPGLKPEYIDSCELGYQTKVGKFRLSSELYYRATENLMERVRIVDENSVTRHTFENVGEEYAAGAEFGVNSRLLNWWKINYMANLYDYRLESDLADSESNQDDFNWSLRFNNTFTFNERTQFQLSGMHHSSSKTSQGEREGFTMINAALKYSFIPKKLTVTLQARDIFDNARREIVSEGTDFYSYLYRDMDAPFITLKISYNINNYKPDRKKRENGGDENGDGDEGF
ncbi:MAG: hypothetical protein B6244_13605 [Candidatus Cloacimonetes bacterium 4572_55]|nr:MAG: hypothetical protein B6244_13605 [Candidatus Cloacimonetes bacterium 4572_55]